MLIFVHSYVNFCIIRRATDPNLFCSLRLLISKVLIKFKLYLITSVLEKWEKANRLTNVDNSNVDYLHLPPQKGVESQNSTHTYPQDRRSVTKEPQARKGRRKTSFCA